MLQYEEDREDEEDKKPPVRHVWTAEEEDLVLRLVREKVKRVDIAAQIGVTVGALETKIKKLKRAGVTASLDVIPGWGPFLNCDRF